MLNIKKKFEYNILFYFFKNHLFELEFFIQTCQVLKSQNSQNSIINHQIACNWNFWTHTSMQSYNKYWKHKNCSFQWENFNITKMKKFVYCAWNNWNAKKKTRKTSNFWLLMIVNFRISITQCLINEFISILKFWNFFIECYNLWYFNIYYIIECVCVFENFNYMLFDDWILNDIRIVIFCNFRVFFYFAFW